MRIAYCEPNTCALPDARNARQRILQLARQKVGDVDIVVASAVVIERDDQQEADVCDFATVDALLLHFLRQERDRLLHFVLHLDLRDVGIGAGLRRSR